MKAGLCVLITNSNIARRTGSELYVRDLATQLINRGHKPVVYSPHTGELAEVLRSRSIPVVQDLESIAITPDLIHGQHHLETMTALTRFPGTPAIFLCHGWLPWEEIPPVHPRIVRYLTVSEAVRDRLIYESGIPAEKITTMLNAVDLDRFRPRPPLPEAPKRALVFNSYIDDANVLDIIRKACARNSIEMDVIGYASRTVDFKPEARLPAYDIIFAQGRSALEGLAVGAAVICCGLEGAGPMVTTANLDHLRRNNFGIRVHNKPLTSDVLSAEIERYDPEDAARVCEQVRATAGLEAMADRVLEAYDAALNDWAKVPTPSVDDENLAFSGYLRSISERIDQVTDAGSGAHARMAALQLELDRVKATRTWRLHQWAVSFPLLQGPLLWLLGLLRRGRAHGAKRDKGPA